MDSFMYNFATNFTANVASDGTGSLTQCGVKTAILMTPKGKIEAGERALELALAEMQNCKYIPPVRRKRLSERIQNLREDRKRLPPQIKLWNIRIQYKIASKAEQFMKNGLQIHRDAKELSTDSTLNNWTSINDKDYAASHDNLPFSCKDTQSNPCAGNFELVDVFATPTPSPTTPRAWVTPDQESFQGTFVNVSTSEPALGKHVASPPSPSPSTEPMLESISYPPSTAKPTWVSEKPLGGKAFKLKNHFFLGPIGAGQAERC